MQTQSEYYDVIVVGGRVAGSTLAARLGKYNIRVLLLERAEFPSLPAVSSPIIYASTMRLLDEIGADEAAYAHNTPKIHHMHSVGSRFNGKLRIPDYEGRDYGYAVDRARFDAALWDTAMQYATVDGRQGFSVRDVCFDGDRVIGVTGKAKDGDTQTFHADVVVGADGRFGIVGRKVGAEETDIHDAHPTSNYYAYWENVTLLEPDTPTAVAYEGTNAYGYLTMDSADGQTAVGVEGRSDEVNPDGQSVEDFYLAMLKRSPALWERLENATMVTSVRGMKNIGNSYKQAGGAGWALVGDAYHQKDPLDGQGIYNAVVTSKALAQSIGRWKAGMWSWEKALREYDEVARVKTYPQYKTLQNQVRTSFYASQSLPIPPQMMNTLSRWMLEDEQFNNLVGKMLTRQLPPDMLPLLAPPTILGAAARGGIKDIQKRIRERLPF